jgi:4a-hydroxytetrahydrobiopterin dehydratase
MENLAEEKCVACRKGELALTGAEIENLKYHVPEWQVRDVDGVPRLERTFKFKNFDEALKFTNAVGAIAEEQDHHPRIVTEWGRVTLQWWTHVIGGLHRNDFVMAARSDQIYGVTGPA